MKEYDLVQGPAMYLGGSDGGHPPFPRVPLHGMIWFEVLVCTWVGPMGATNPEG